VILFRNAFSVLPTDLQGERKHTHVFTPFTVVSVQNYDQNHKSVVRLKMYRMHLSELHTLTFFGRNASSYGSQLVVAVRSILADLTLSLFPWHHISVLPLSGVEATHRRIMAGYLLEVRHEQDSVCVVYGELQSHMFGKAIFALYTNEQCNYLVDTFIVTNNVTLVSYESVDSNFFEMDNRRFCARTSSTQKLWLRALINIKMKLMCDAPDSSEKQLTDFRSSLLEQMELLKITELSSETGSKSLLPLLLD